MVWTQISLPGIKVSTVLENRVQFLTHILFSNLADVLTKDTDTKDTEFQIDIVNNKGQTSWIMSNYMIQLPTVDYQVYSWTFDMV